MTSSAHIAAGALAYLVATALAEAEVCVEGMAVTVFASLLPDIDTPSSSIGRPFFPLARWINRRVGHRTASHSVLGVLGFGFLVLGLIWIVDWLFAGVGGVHESLPLADSWISQTARTENLEPRTSSHYTWLLILGYTSHILVDTFNKTGVELFWPARLRCVFFLNQKYRIKSAGTGDYWFMTLCLVLSLGMYPLARDGFTLSIHRFFGDIYSVVLDYREYGDKNRIWLNLEGVEAISNQKTKGRYEILAICENASVLIDRNGAKQLVSRTPPLQIFPEKVSIEIGEAVQITAQEIDMTGRTFGEIPQFPDAERVLLYGHLTPARFANLSIWEDRFNVLSRSLDKIKLEHAEYKDILDQNLQHVLVREGMLVAKIYRVASEAGAAVAQDVPDPAGERIRMVEIRIDPSDQILLKVGDVVAVGQVIARTDISAKLEELTTSFLQESNVLTQKLQATQLEFDETQRKLDTKTVEKTRMKEGLVRLTQEALLVTECVRLRTTHDALEQDELQFRKRIADLEKEILQLETEKRLAAKTADRKKAQLERDATIPASFGGKILRIDRHPEGEKIRLSVLYQQGTE